MFGTGPGTRVLKQHTHYMHFDSFDPIPSFTERSLVFLRIQHEKVTRTRFNCAAYLSLLERWVAVPCCVYHPNPKLHAMNSLLPGISIEDHHVLDFPVVWVRNARTSGRDNYRTMLTSRWELLCRSKRGYRAN